MTDETTAPDPEADENLEPADDVEPGAPADDRSDDELDTPRVPADPAAPADDEPADEPF